jgi:hypothetical protein
LQNFANAEKIAIVVKNPSVKENANVLARSLVNVVTTAINYD